MSLLIMLPWIYAYIYLCLLSAEITGIHTAAGLDLLNTINVRRPTYKLCQDLLYADILKDIRVEKLNCAIACMNSLLFPNDYRYKLISCLKVLLGFPSVLKTNTHKGPDRATSWWGKRGCLHLTPNYNKHEANTNISECWDSLEIILM